MILGVSYKRNNRAKEGETTRSIEHVSWQTIAHLPSAS